MKKDEIRSTRIQTAASRSSSWTYEGSSGFIPSRIMGVGLTGPRHQVRIESTQLNVRLLSDIFDEHLAINGSENRGDVGQGQELIASV